ncbi:MAG: hypothetical protein M3O01_13945 [Pseudomonadota bacterium]|nr:hypothetical protein [Pseudomonadota bacterium]
MQTASRRRGPRLTLRSLAYRRTVARSTTGAGLVGDTAALASLAARAALPTLDDARPVDEHVITSTVLSPLLFDSGPLAEAFRGDLARSLGRPLDWMTCAYECAGWGYVLRDQCAQAAESGRCRRLLLQVLDVDIHRLSFWLHNARWGPSGFGIATAVIDIGPGDEPAGGALPVQVGAATPGHAMTQLARALRQFCRTRPGVLVALPFFPASQRQALVRAIDAHIAPDGHDQYGHCFGSDPWISMLLGLADPARPSPERIVISSLALNGYRAIAELNVAPDVRCELERAPLCSPASEGESRRAHRTSRPVDSPRDPDASRRDATPPPPASGTRLLVQHYRLARRNGMAVFSTARAYVIPLGDADDHARIHDSQPAQRTPVWLDHFQYVHLLSNIAALLWQALGEEARLYIHIRSPFHGALPAELLDSRVLLGSGLTARMHEHAGAPTRPAVSIVDRIRRDLDGPGDNTLCCHPVHRRWGAAVRSALTRAGSTQGVWLEPVGQHPGLAVA